MHPKSDLLEFCSPLANCYWHSENDFFESAFACLAIKCQFSFWHFLAIHILLSEEVIFCHSRFKITRLYFFLSIYFLIKWLFHIDLSFNLFFRDFIVLLRFFMSLSCYSVLFFVILL